MCRMETFDLADADPDTDTTDTHSGRAPPPAPSHAPILVLDGSHNALSVSLCVSGLRERYPAKQGFDLWVAFGSGKDKNLEAMLAAVLQSSDSVIATVSKHFRAQGAWQLVARKCFWLL
jgi:folylpolyglutamate synthase/dihydropteroate synthase